MPLYEFNCPVHGSFDVRLSFKDALPSDAPCPASTDRIVDASGELIRGPGCCEVAPRVLTPPAGIIVMGGTGAGRGHG